MSAKKSRRRPTLRVSIISSLIILISLSNIGIIGLMYFYSQRFSKDLLNDSMDRVTRRVQSETSRYFTPPVTAIQYYQRAFEHNILDPADFNKLEPLLYETISSSRSIEMLNLGLADGSFLMLKRMPSGAIHTKYLKKGEKNWHLRDNGKFAITKKEPIPNDSYDPRKRPWYQGAASQKGIHWTDVYIFYSDKQPGITVGIPIYSNGAIVGVIAADIGLKQLSDFLAGLFVSKNGKVAILGKGSFPVATHLGIKVKKQQDDNLSLFSLSDYGDSVLHKLANISQKTDQTYSGSFTYSNDLYSLKILPLNSPPGKGWRVAVMIPEKDFLSRFKSITYKALIMVVVIFLIALLAGIFVATLMSKPLNHLIEEVEKLQRFEFKSKPERVFAPFHEISEVLSSFDNMKLGLRALEKYVPSDLVRVLLRQTSEVELGGQTKYLSIMFTDIEGFTSISEKMQPMEITNYLADYLDIMSTIIRKYHGTVDKYIGDAVMAFWGAPLDVENQELQACEAALLCKQSIEELDTMNPDRPPFRTRFGISAGEVLVGNIGSNNRFNYTIIGDHVNVTSRLESINKVYGTSIIISSFVYTRVSAVMLTRKLDLVAVK
ncbi:hypothetical protein KJ865_02065, partial [Myxococcota bacterium]|nr:hypothetical protein [Myxococcota bacterium]